MSIFDQAYDQMTWRELTCRLPAELAVKAVKRRVNTLDDLKEFMGNCKADVVKNKDINCHVNGLIRNHEVDDILEAFPDEHHHKVLFAWLDADNSNRIKSNSIDTIDIKLAFNLTKGSDAEGLNTVLDRVLEDDSPKPSFVQSVLEKADADIFLPLVDKALRDSRPEVRAVPICLRNQRRRKLTDHQQLISLKAYVKSNSSRSLGVLDYKLFSGLRVDERYGLMKRYLESFPRFRKLNCFDPMPTDSEFDFLLFAGSIDYNDEMQYLKQLYEEITQMDPPLDDNEEGDDV